MRGLFREALNYLVHALDTARSTSLDHAELLYGAGSVAFEMGDYTTSQEWYDQLLELGRARGDVRVIAKSLAILADVALQAGDQERSRTLLLDAAEAARACDDMFTLLLVTHGLGAGALDAGDAETARKHFQHSLGLARELQNARSEGIALGRLSLVALLEGDTDEAAACLDGALRLMELSETRRGRWSAWWDRPRSA